MTTIILLIASQIKGGKLDRYQTLQIKAVIQIPVEITETLAVPKKLDKRLANELEILLNKCNF